MPTLAALTAQYKRAAAELEAAVRRTLPVGQWCLYDAPAIRQRNGRVTELLDQMTERGRAAYLAESGWKPEEPRRLRVIGYCIEHDLVQVDPPRTRFSDGKPCTITADTGRLEPIPGEGLVPGDVVIVRGDDWARSEHVVTRPPWRLGHGAWVVGLAGVTGGYDLGRVEYLKGSRA